MKSYCALLFVAGFATVCASGQTPASQFNTGQAARIVIGQPNFTAQAIGASNVLLGSPSGIALLNGTLWVADSNRLSGLPDNNRVLLFDVSSFPTITQNPTIPGATCGVCLGQASLVLGQPNFSTTTAALTATGVRNPTAIATDGNVLVVADTDNNRVLIWKHIPTANAQPADVVLGQTAFAQNTVSSPPTASSLRGPEGVWIAGGKLFVADTSDNRVLIWNQIPMTNNAPANLVIGQPNFTSFVQPDLTSPANATTSASNMQTPVAVSTDGARMYVTDLGQSRVLIWNQIPTANGAPADIALGQPDLVSATANNSFIVTNATTDSDNNPTGASPVLCPSDAAFAANQGQIANQATDSDGTVIYPTRCAATMSFPRFAFSDGVRLFVADGGNDRVMVWDSIPTMNGQPADQILGQPDQFTDATGFNPTGTNALQAPTSLAWDPVNQNLYVSDTYNRRVVVFSPGPLDIPKDGVRNAASINIQAIGTVLFQGTIQAKDTVTVTIAGTDYKYTVQSTDTLTTVAEAIAKMINQAPDPNVIATVDATTNTLILTARVSGAQGSSITLAVTVSSGAQITPVASGTTLSLNLEDPTSIAPGTLISVFGQNLCGQTASADLTQSSLPLALGGCQLFMDGTAVPLLYVSSAQVNAQMPLYFGDRTSVTAYMRDTSGGGTVTASANIAVTVVPANPGIFAEPGNDPRAGIFYHGSSSATAAITVAGSIHAGDVATITIGSATYTYTVQASDTLSTVTTALINAINGAPDPNVYATAANENNVIILTALTPGPAGEGTTVSVSVTGTNAVLSLTANNSSLCCDNQQGAQVTLDNPAVPGEFVYLYATGLGPTSPLDVNTGQVFQGTVSNPPAVPVDSILTGSVAGNLINTSLLPGAVGVYYVLFQISPSATTDPLAQTTIAQQSHVSNVVTMPIEAPGSPFVTAAASTPAAASAPATASTPATATVQASQGQTRTVGTRP